MERERGIFSRFLKRFIVIYPIWFTTGCVNAIQEDGYGDTYLTVIELDRPGYRTKTPVQDEEGIRDLNLLIYRNGDLEEHIHESDPEESDDGRCILSARLMSGHRYNIYAFANFGGMIEASDEEELQKLIYSLDEPENLYLRGLPMLAVSKNVRLYEEGRIYMTFERLAAKISMKMDRSRLSEDVDMKVRRVTVGNSPSNASVFESNRVLSIYDRFEEGWSISDVECTPLNTIGRGGISEAISLYMLENMQGDFPYTITEDKEKAFAEKDERAQLCSYMEIELEYSSATHYVSEKNLIYRFYLGEGLQDLNIERNCHYHIVVSPDDDGLSGSGWRVDKTGIGTYVQDIQLSDDYVALTYKGEEHMLYATFLPSDATDRTVIWESSDTLIAKVDSEGCLKAMGEGDCTIRCKAQDGSNAETQCEVNVKYAPPYFIMYPGEYIEGKVGDEIHIWCDFFPPNAPFNPGYEELDYDKSRGIYDYRIDEDGHGAVLTLRNPGTGIVLMSAGEPVNQSGMAIIVVRQH